MNCRYCGAINPNEEHRCLRCGRRLGAVAPPHPQSSALPAADPDPPPVVPLPKRDPGTPRAPHQQSLFRVIPFESIAPARRDADARTRRPQPKATNRRPPHPDQPDLSFPPPPDEPAPPAVAAAKPAVQCEAPVAPIRSRLKAGAIDALYVLAADALLMGIFAGYTRQLPLSRTAGLVYAAVLALLLLLYGLLACLLSDRSPGARIAGLHLLHFDGRPATRRHRLLRLAASCLSILPLGLGYLWALLDEEHLTFHDHISETFPTV